MSTLLRTLGFQTPWIWDKFGHRHIKSIPQKTFHLRRYIFGRLEKYETWPNLNLVYASLQKKYPNIELLSICLYINACHCYYVTFERLINDKIVHNIYFDFGCRFSHGCRHWHTGRSRTGKEKTKQKNKKVTRTIDDTMFFLYHIIDRYFIPGKSTSLQGSGISKPTILSILRSH